MRLDGWSAFSSTAMSLTSVLDMAWLGVLALPLPEMFSRDEIAGKVCPHDLLITRREDVSTAASALDTLINNVQFVRVLLVAIEALELPLVHGVAELFTVGTPHQVTLNQGRLSVGVR